MILAGIDIGTNTLRLLVAETGRDSFQVLCEDRKITRLGQELDRGGMLTREAMDRSLKALESFSRDIRHHAALQTAVIGTSALRIAKNAASFISDVKEKTGLEIRVITGEEEARLTLAGVFRVLKGFKGLRNDTLESALVVDIGGGSTEIIAVHAPKKPTMASLPLGAVYLTDRFIKNDPPEPVEIASLRRAIGAILEQHAGWFKAGPGTVFIGTAGTITTLAAMDLELEEYDPDKINCHPLTREAVNAIVRTLSTTPIPERRTMPGLEAGREDIILAGAVVTQEIMKKFGCATMIVSDWGLREGIVLDLYERLNEED